MDRHIAFITLTWRKVMPFHIQKMSKILQHIHTISPLCINMIVVILIILLNLMMLPKESKNKATIEQKKNTNWLKITSISSFTLKWFKAHSTLMFEEIILKKKSVYNFKWNRNEMDEIINDQREKWCDGL